VGAGAERLDDFDSYELVRPHRVVIRGTLASTIKAGRARPCFAIRRRDSRRGDQVGPPTYEAEVLAIDSLEAEAMVINAAGASVKVVSMAAT
jgi:hypothetical protein